MKILVTGSKGFIGSHLVEELKRLNYEVVSFPADITGSFELPEVDCLFHLAALTNIKKCSEEPEEAIRINVSGTLNVLKAAKKAGIKKFIYMSTLGVYGNPEELPCKEDGPIHPEEFYSMSKYIGELITKTFCKQNNINFNIVRSFNVYGPKQREEFAIPFTVKQAVEGIVSLRNLDTTRDFYYISDLINGLTNLIGSGKNGEVYNFGSGKETSIKDIIEILEGILDKKLEINLKDSKPLVLRSQADITKSKQDFNWEPKVSLKEGLQKMVDYYGKK